jgi:MraZ protein
VFTGFVGEYKHTLDAKGRVSLPAAFRRSLPEGESLYLYADKEGAVRVYPGSAYTEWLDKLFPKKKSSDELYNDDATNGYSPLSRDDRTKRRLIASQTREVMLDSAGRISVPDDLIAKAGIERDVCVIGDVDHIELWNADKWHEFQTAAAEAYDQIFDEI